MGHSSLARPRHSRGAAERTQAGDDGSVEVLSPDAAHDAEVDRREQEKATRQQKQTDEDKKKVIRAMAILERQHPEGNATTAIRDRSYLKGVRFTTALEAVVTEGYAVECEFQRSNHKTPTHGYKLVEGTE